LLGITINSSDECKNADDSIRVKREFDSNVIDESDLQFEKHSEPTISTFCGIMIDLSDDDENANDSIRVKCEFDSNVIDEVIYTMKNSVNQEFQHCLELRLIEVMNMKIQMIQFMSNVNLIQM
jgi:hypothetical protein